MWMNLPLAYKAGWGEWGFKKSSFPELGKLWWRSGTNWRRILNVWNISNVIEETVLLSSDMSSSFLGFRHKMSIFRSMFPQVWSVLGTYTLLGIILAIIVLLDEGPAQESQPRTAHISCNSENTGSFPSGIKKEENIYCHFLYSASC